MYGQVSVLEFLSWYFYHYTKPYLRSHRNMIIYKTHRNCASTLCLLCYYILTGAYGVDPVVTTASQKKTWEIYDSNIDYNAIVLIESPGRIFNCIWFGSSHHVEVCALFSALTFSRKEATQKCLVWVPFPWSWTLAPSALPPASFLATMGQSCWVAQSLRKEELGERKFCSKEHKADVFPFS